MQQQTMKIYLSFIQTDRITGGNGYSSTPSRQVSQRMFNTQSTMKVISGLSTFRPEVTLCDWRGIKIKKLTPWHFTHKNPDSLLW